MRLLNTKTGRFHWVEDPRQIRYAILSHVWSKDPQHPEQSYQDVQLRIDAARTPGASILDDPSLSDKIRSFCRVAQKQGFDFGWADSCCIDRTSSSELSEAITSMYHWYRCADLCLAYLHDVHVTSDTPTAKRNLQFGSSRWFLRGWTLQELLAPSLLLFLSSTWDVIGSKQTSAALVARVTNIDADVLTFQRPLHEVSVACKMSWAASRNTTREEDEAYCLMGIFGVSIPIIYGEGRHAFVRLQEEIIRTIPDQSIFAWGRILRAQHPLLFGRPDDAAVASTPHPPPVPYPSPSNQYLLASSPRDFEASSCIVHLSRDQFAQRLDIPPEFTYQVFTVTAHGVHAQFPLVGAVVKDLHGILRTYLAFLACETQDDGSLLALLLCPRAENLGSGFAVGAGAGNLAPAAFLGASDLKNFHYRALYLSLQDIHRIRQQHVIRMASLYIPYRPLPDAKETKHDQRLFRTLQQTQLEDHFNVLLSTWSRTLLSLDGSRVIEPDRDDDSIVLQDRYLNSNLTPGVVIAHKGIHINIQIGYCKCTVDRRFQVVPGVLVWSPHAESSLEQPFKDVPHPVDHPAHICSWSFHDGVASTSVDLQPFSSPLERITVRLSLYHPSAESSTKVYRLGVEVTSSEIGTHRPVAHNPSIHPLKDGSDRDPETTSHIAPHWFPVRERTRSRSFSAPYTVEPSSMWQDNHIPTASFESSSVPAAALPSPPITTTNSKISSYPATDWNEYFSGPLRHLYTPQEFPRSSSRRSTTENVSQYLLHEGPEFSTRSRRHSFEDGRVQSPYSLTRDYAIRARDDSSITSGRIASNQQHPRLPSTAMLADVETYSTYLGDISTGTRSVDLVGRVTLNPGEKDDFRLGSSRVPAVVRVNQLHEPGVGGDLAAPDFWLGGNGQYYSSQAQLHPRGRLPARTQTLFGPPANSRQDPAAFDTGVAFEPGVSRGRQNFLLRSNHLQQPRARSAPDSPGPRDLGRGSWPPPRKPRGEGEEDHPPQSGMQESKDSPGGQTSPDGWTQMDNLKSLQATSTTFHPLERPIDAQPPMKDALSIPSLMSGSDGHLSSPPVQATQSELATERDEDAKGAGAGMTRPALNVGLMLRSTSSRAFNSLRSSSGIPSWSRATDAGVGTAQISTGRVGQGGHGDDGAHKGKRQRSDFIRGLPFLRKFASS